MPVYDYTPKVGDLVHYEEGLYSFEGIIGEILSDKFYIWHNNIDAREGSVGSKKPETLGKRYSWVVYKNANHEIKIIKETKKITKNSMSLLSQIKSLTRSEPEKTFVNAGVMNEDLTLTAEGKDLFLDFLLESNKAKFKTDVVDKIVEAQEAAKK